VLCLQWLLILRSCCAAVALRWQLAATVLTMAASALNGSASTAAMWRPGSAGEPPICARRPCHDNPQQRQVRLQRQPGNDSHHSAQCACASAGKPLLASLAYDVQHLATCRTVLKRSCIWLTLNYITLVCWLLGQGHTCRGRSCPLSAIPHPTPGTSCCLGCGLCRCSIRSSIALYSSSIGVILRNVTVLSAELHFSFPFQ